jgi:hypothetical protein
MSTQQIWYKDISQFVQPSNLPKFVPMPSMTLAEKLNATLRFSIYFALVLYLAQRQAGVVFVPIFVAIFTYALYAFYDSNAKAETDMLLAMNLTKSGPKKRETCVLPTHNNPMGNILVSDYVLNPDRPPACPITSNAIKRKAERIMSSLYKDVDDIWSAKTSTRNFYQTPIQTIPNKQTEFAEWLYKSGKTCKEGNGGKCLLNLHRDIKQ